MSLFCCGYSLFCVCVELKYCEMIVIYFFAFLGITDILSCN